VTHRREVALQVGEERAFGAPLQHLGDEGAARRENGTREIGRGLGKADNSEMVRLLMTHGVGGHVRQNHVRGAAEPLDQPLRRLGREEIEFYEFGTGKRFDRQEVDSDNAAAALGAPDLPSCDLRPAARRRAKVHNPMPRLQQLELLVELQELVGGSRPIALALRPRHIVVVELALEPTLGGNRAFAGGLHPLLEAARA
jgi:hypothetical protein